MKLKPGEFYMTLDDFKQAFKYYTITYLKKDFKNSFIEKRSSVNRRLYKFNFSIGQKELTGKSGAGKIKLVDETNLQVGENSQTGAILHNLSEHLLES